MPPFPSTGRGPDDRDPAMRKTLTFLREGPLKRSTPKLIRNGERPAISSPPPQNSVERRLFLSAGFEARIERETGDFRHDLPRVSMRPVLSVVVDSAIISTGRFETPHR